MIFFKSVNSSEMCIAFFDTPCQKLVVSRVDKVPDSQSEGPGFDSQSLHFQDYPRKHFFFSFFTNNHQYN